MEAAGVASSIFERASSSDERERNPARCAERRTGDIKGEELKMKKPGAGGGCARL